MKTLTMTAVIALASTLSISAFAESTVGKSIVLNQSYNRGNATVAVGYDNLASTGSINIKDSKVKESIVLNRSFNRGNATVAIGVANTASTGSVIIE